MAKVEYEDIVEALYDALLDDQAWPATMLRLADYVGGHGTVFLNADVVRGVVLESETFGVDEHGNEIFLRDFSDKEIRVPGAARVPVGQVVTEQSFVDLTTLRSSDIFNGLLRPFDVPYIVTFAPERSPTSSASFSVQRSERIGPADRAEVERLQSFVPHLTRVLRLRRLLEGLRNQRNTLWAWLERGGQAVVFVDPAGRIMSLSSAAESLLLARRYVSVLKGHLVARSSRAAEPLARAIAAVARRGERRDSAVSIPLADDKAVAHVVPVSPSRGLHGGPTAMVVIVESDSGRGPAATDLQRVLGLTPAESRLAQSLFRYGRLRVCAEQLGVSIHTCRTQLKSIYAKTGCHTRAELVRRLAELPSSSPSFDNSF